MTRKEIKNYCIGCLWGDKCAADEGVCEYYTPLSGETEELYNKIKYLKEWQEYIADRGGDDIAE